VDDGSLMSEDPKLIVRVITFGLTQHVHPRYHNVTDGHTDGQTTFDSNTALALRASCGKNAIQKQKSKSNEG